MSTQGGIQGFRRTALAATVSVAAILLSVSAALAGPAASQEAPSAEATIDTGTATGKAQVVSVSPSAGSLAFAISSGAAIAETSGGLAQAFAQSVDLGLIGSSLTAEPCTGDDPALEPEQLPQPTQMDNRNGGGEAESAEAPVLGTSLGAGVERVVTTRTPSSRASVTSVAADLSPVISVGGGRSTAEAEVFPRAGREARAGVEVDLEIAGVIRMTGLRWAARHRTGPQPGVDGGFEIGALELLGLPIPAGAIEPTAAFINAVLAPLGFRIEIPQVERITEPVDLIRVTPLRLVIDDSPLGAQIVRPAMQLTQDMRFRLVTLLERTYCRTSDVILVGEIGLGVASGTGSFALEIGGVEARSAEVVEENPFGDDEPRLPVVAPAIDGGPVPDEQAAPSLPPAPVPATHAAGPQAPAAVSGVSATYHERCESSHPDRPLSCSRGAAGLVAAIGAVATAGVGVLDLRRRRRAVTTVPVGG